MLRQGISFPGASVYHRRTNSDQRSIARLIPAPEDPETILLIDSREDQAAIDVHHSSPVMERITILREKYDLHMSAERFVSAETPETEDSLFIRK